MSDINLPSPITSNEYDPDRDMPEFVKWLSRLEGSTMSSDVYRALRDFGRASTRSYALERAGGNEVDPVVPEAVPTPDMNRLLKGAVELPMVVGAPLTPSIAANFGRILPKFQKKVPVTVPSKQLEEELLDLKLSKIIDDSEYGHKVGKLDDMYAPDPVTAPAVDNMAPADAGPTPVPSAFNNIQVSAPTPTQMNMPQLPTATTQQSVHTPSTVTPGQMTVLPPQGKGPPAGYDLAEQYYSGFDTGHGYNDAAIDEVDNIMGTVPIEDIASFPDLKQKVEAVLDKMGWPGTVEKPTHAEAKLTYSDFYVTLQNAPNDAWDAIQTTFNVPSTDVAWKKYKTDENFAIELNGYFEQFIKADPKDVPLPLGWQKSVKPTASNWPSVHPWDNNYQPTEAEDVVSSWLLNLDPPSATNTGTSYENMFIDMQQSPGLIPGTPLHKKFEDVVDYAFTDVDKGLQKFTENYMLDTDFKKVVDNYVANSGFANATSLEDFTKKYAYPEFNKLVGATKSQLAGGLPRFRDNAEYKKLIKEEVSKVPVLPKHTQYGIPAGDHIPGRTLYHGTRDPLVAKEIERLGFQKGQSAEIGISGTSMSEDPLLSLNKFANGQYDAMLASKLGEDTAIHNMRPSEYLEIPKDWAKTPDTLKPFHKPQARYREDEIFFPGSPNQISGSRQLLAPKHLDDAAHKAWFKDSQAYVDEAYNYINTGTTRFNSNTIDGVRLGYDQLARMHSIIEGSQAYGSGVGADLMRDTAYKMNGLGDAMIQRRAKVLGPQRTEALTAVREAANKFVQSEQAAQAIAETIKYKKDPDPALRPEYDKLMSAAIRAKEVFMDKLKMLAVVPAVPLSNTFFSEKEQKDPKAPGAWDEFWGEMRAN